MKNFQISYPHRSKSDSQSNEEETRILALVISAYTFTDFEQPNNGSTYYQRADADVIVARAATFEKYIRGGVKAAS